MDKSANSIFGKFFNMPRFGPAIFSAFIFLLLLLFYKELNLCVQSHLIPSLLAYSLGAALLGFFHRHMGLNYESDINQKNTTEEIKEGDNTTTTVCIRVFNNEKTIPL